MDPAEGLADGAAPLTHRLQHLIQSPQVETPHGFWQTIRAAIRGTHHDYTSGPIGRAIILLAVPMVLEMLMESLFAVVDIFWVAHIGADAVATVGLTESLLTLVYTAAMGLSIGVTAMVARRIGEKNSAGAAEAAVQGIALGVITALVIGVSGVWLAPKLLGVMGAAPDVIAIGQNYTRIMLGGNVVILLIFLINAIFRGAGDAAIAMRVLWLANWINIILGPLLIFGVGPFPRLGLTGAAIATTIGRGTGVLYQLYRLWRRDGRVVIHRDHIALQPVVMKTLLRLSATGTFQVFVGMASWIGLTRINASFGTDALAGYQIAIRIIIFALLPSWGLANAAATMVGQALGAGKPERGEQAVWKAAFYNVMFLGTAGLVFVIFANPIAHVFTNDPDVAAIAASCLRIISYGYLFYAYGMVLTNSFNGAGDTWTPTWLNLFCFWLWEIPLAWWLAVHFNQGPRGVAWAVTIAFSTLAVASAVLFRRGRWKLKTV
ncbi:MAG TPA: MATE family efflux transporter [Gemmatimonadales bacterium]|nr:MATE family efflux transporter [Gemmatimonadales bacterium]